MATVYGANTIFEKFYEKLSDDIFNNIVLNYNSHWGLQSFLDYEDKNSMAYGVECRVPFLYDDIGEFSLNTNLDKHLIGFKAKTSEKMGFIGEKEGAACMVLCRLQK